MNKQEKKPSNTEAFPSTDLQTVHFHGMTLRDYFANSAMNGLMSKYGVDSNYTATANESYKVADTMLKQREL